MADELRRILLTDELLRLPQVMAEFIETTNRRSEEADRRSDSMEHAQRVHSRHISDMKAGS